MRTIFILFLFFLLPVVGQELVPSNIPTTFPVIQGVPTHDALQQQQKHIQHIRQRSEERRVALQNLQIDNNRIYELPPQQIYEDQVVQVRNHLEQNKLDIEQRQKEIENLQARLNQNEQRINNLLGELQKWQNPAFLQNEDIYRNINELKNIIALFQSKQSLDLEELLLLKEEIRLEEAYRSALNIQYRIFNERYLAGRSTSSQHITPQQEQIEHHSKKIDELHALLSSLSRQAPRLQRQRLNMLLHIEEQLLLLSKQDALLFQQQKRVQELEFADITTLSINQLENTLNEIRQIKENSKSIAQQLQHQHGLFIEQFNIYQRQKEFNTEEIIDKNKTYLEYTDQIQQDIKLLDITLEELYLKGMNQYEQLKQEHLKERFNFGDSFFAFNKLIADALKAPHVFWGQYKISFGKIYASFLALNSWEWLKLSLVSIIGVLMTVIGLNKINRIEILKTSSAHQLAFSKQLTRMILLLIQKNLFLVLLTALTFIIINTLKLTQPNYGLLAIIPVTLLIANLPISLTKILDASPLINFNTPRYFHFISAIILIVCISMSMTVMARLVLIDEHVISFYEWFFGLMCLFLVYPAIYATHTTRRILREYYKKTLWSRIYSSLVILLPLMLIIFSVCSTVGYINFAWSFATYMLYLIGIVFVWGILVALLNDLALWIKRYALKHTSTHLFWIKDVINPTHILLNLFVTYLMFMWLIHIYGWNTQTPIIRSVIRIFTHPIFGTDSSIQVSLLIIFLFILILYAIYRLGSLIRSFSYHLLFSHIHDAGIRNSLSAFCQYFVTTLGFLISLKVIGIDLTTLAVFAGALGVGIGFGLQNLVNNFISGILLLIERPLRNGDYVIINGQEGEVTRIGMRSLTIRTYDYEEIFIPNSDLVTTSFTNITYSDQFRRFIIYINISYRHHPDTICRLISDELQTLVDEDVIASDPAFGVFAYNYNEYGISFRIQFYINLSYQSVLNGRHIVVSRIWQSFSRHHIEIAYPRRELLQEPHHFGERDQLHDLQGKSQ